MDYGWMTHALGWLIAGMSVLTAIGALSAMFAMGRTGYNDQD
ncbi:hypothetical protein [Microbacterium sp. No. 7]|nr:hypothetical protein [Microbacterium sp. No. 7]